MGGWELAKQGRCATTVIRVGCSSGAWQWEAGAVQVHHVGVLDRATGVWWVGQDWRFWECFSGEVTSFVVWCCLQVAKGQWKAGRLIATEVGNGRVFGFKLTFQCKFTCTFEALAHPHHTRGGEAGVITTPLQGSLTAVNTMGPQTCFVIVGRVFTLASSLNTGDPMNGRPPRLVNIDWGVICYR